jgi:hypothetical protein
LDDIQDNDTMKNNKKTNTGREKTTDWAIQTSLKGRERTWVLRDRQVVLSENPPWNWYFRCLRRDIWNDRENIQWHNEKRQKDKHWPRKNYRLSNTNITKRQGEDLGAPG